MKTYLSNESALQYWNFPLAQKYFATRMALADTSHYMVLSKADRFTSEGATCHVCSTKIPKKSLIIHGEIGVVSPSLMFVQLTQNLDIFESIILGTLLCSCPDGPWSTPLVDKAELLKFARVAKGLRGQEKALNALKYIKDRACSIMEVFVDLYLGLPNYLGGLNLQGGIFNYKVELDTEGSVALGQSICYIDYCFPKEKIAYEYLGDGHNSSVDYDSGRNMALKRMGYHVITITKSQLYNASKLSQILHEASDVHGKKIRIRTEKYKTSRQRIQQLLPRPNANINAVDLANQTSSDKVRTQTRRKT